jgi:uncharacterized protein (TIGR00251 family)
LKKSSFYRWEGDILVLNILGTPGASKDAIGKVKGNQLKVSVTEAPRVGRATDHMVRFLADEFGVSRSDIEVVFGRKNVNKQLRIKAPSRLPACIEPAATALPSPARTK